MGRPTIKTMHAQAEAMRERIADLKDRCVSMTAKVRRYDAVLAERDEARAQAREARREVAEARAALDEERARSRHLADTIAHLADQLDGDRLVHAVQAARGNVTSAARAIGMNPATLKSQLKRRGLLAEARNGSTDRGERAA